MKKIIMLILLFFLLPSVFAISQTFTGSVFNAEAGDLILARVEGENFLTEVLNNKYTITVEGNEDSEVQFWMKDRIIHRERLKSGIKQLDLDASKTSTTISPSLEKTEVVTPPQQHLPPPARKTFSFFWIILLLVILLAVGGVIYYFYRNNWQLPFKTSKKEVKIPPKILLEKKPSLTPPKIPLKKEIKIPPKIFEKKKELTSSQSNSAVKTLKEYVNSMKKKGFNINQIKAALLTKGWKKELIERAISQNKQNL